MKIVPIKQKQAKDFVNSYHRHNAAPVGSIFQIGLQKDDKLIGVIMVGRPISYILDDGNTLEINRTCVLDNQKNACSKLMSAAIRAGRALGYQRIITYTLQFESGSSLRAVGFVKEHEFKGQSWKSKTREPKQESLFQEYTKIRWIKQL